MMLNKVSLNTIGLNRIGLNRIGKPSRGSSDRPYIDPEVLASLKAVCICYGKSNDDPDRAVVKNLVDPDNPFVISNAAFKLNSGFGGFVEDFTSWNRIDSSTAEISNDGSKIKCINTTLNVQYLFNSINRDIPSFKVKISNFTKGDITYYYRKEDGIEAFLKINPLSVVNSDKVIELPKSYNTVENGTGSRGGFYSSNINIGVTIIQIPSFEGAFVTDGIDDLITSTKTVQEMLGGSNEITVVSMIHGIGSKNAYTNVLREYGYNYIRNTSTADGKTGIYGYTSKDTTKSIITDILGDKNDYKLEYIQTSTPSTINSVFSVAGWRDNSGSMVVYPIAWYWTIIANKVLTTDQINQVIAYFNLDRTLKPDILCNTIKQGITNENHAEFGDKLIDFSGNGRDIQLNNIAWKGDSGIGKYAADFTSWTTPNGVQKTSDTVKITTEYTENWIAYFGPNTFKFMKVLISGIPDGGALHFFRTTADGGDIKMVNGINEIPEFTNTRAAGFYIYVPLGFDWSNLVIEQIPSHAGALCLDGVNDFGKVTGMPIYKDYTVVADREIIDGLAENADGGVALKGSRYLTGAFCFDYKDAAFSFGTPKMIPLDTKRFISYQSKYVSNGIRMNIGTATDNDELWIGRLGNDERYSKIAIRFLMSFPYSMSEFLLERQLKKHKLGTLYPDMVEFRPVIKANANYKITYYQIDSTNTWKSIKVGDYIVIGAKLAFQITFDNDASELKEVVSPQLSGIIVEKRPSNPGYNIYSYITSKSPQKINITIDEYIRYEDIVQPYPVLLRFNDENGNEVSWGGKFKVGSTITRIGSIADPESNLLNGLYSISGLSLNGKAVTSSTSIVEKQMVFKTTATYLLDNNEPNCILSPRLLRIPNSSYKILGHIPDISGHGNHGKINNSAYAEGSGVNEDGSYQFDGVDDFVTIPTLSSGGKQVLMKVNLPRLNEIIYDQRKETNTYTFAIITIPSQIAYDQRNSERITYIDGILNTNIITEQLMGVTHNIVVINSKANLDNTRSPILGRDINGNNWSRMRIYDFMLFDEISTDDKIKELNEYVGVEAKIELPPYYWDAYGKTNLDGDKATIQQRGVAVGDYDLTNYNHAYDKMSGYGGYKFAKFDNTIEWFAEDSSMVVNRNGYLITLKKVPNVAFWRFRNTTLKSLDNPLTFKVKCNKPIDVIFQVKFAKNNDVSIGYNYNIKEVTLVPNESTTIIVPSVSVSDIPEATSILFINVLFDNTSLSDNEEYTVEMLPLYPNGLLYDAVTDYSENVNIPVFTDFTAIMKRKWLKNQGCPLIKGSKVYEGGNGNALLFEWDKAYNFVFYKRTDIMEGEVPDNISFITPTNYNGNVITRGSEQDTNGICIAGDGNAGFANMVFYKLILYPKTIPLLQINFLKNLMERDEIIDLNNKIFIQE